MKYIDAEKLKAFKETLADIIVSSQGLCTYDSCKQRADEETPHLLSTIDSLQQEQPELDVNTLREWSMRYAPDIRQAIEATAYHFWNEALNARKEESDE